MPDVSVPGINWTQVTPEERARLKSLMAHYAKNPHPFTACVRDNTKRFGPERARRICAVLKDLIEGGTHWRGKEGRKMAEAEALSTEELREVIERAEEIMGERRFAYNPGQARAPKGTSIGGQWISILGRAKKKHDDLSDRSDFPVAYDDIEAADALAKRGDLRKTSDRTKSYEITPQGEATLAKAREENAALLDTITPGARVTIRTPHGAERTGRAVMRGPAGWVINLGGAHGTPGVATPDNLVKVSGGSGSGRGLGGDRRSRSSGKAEPRESGADTPQQQAILRQSATARSVRSKFPAGTRVVATSGAGAEPRPGAQEGTVVRHVPGSSAQGGTLVVRWDSGTEGRVSPGSVLPRESGATSPEPPALSIDRREELRPAVRALAAELTDLTGGEVKLRVVSDGVYLDWIEVPEASRGQGRGTRAMERLAKWADRERVAITTRPTNDAARRLNAKFGFRDAADGAHQVRLPR